MIRAAQFLFLLLLLTAAGARAHPILQNPVWIETSPGGLTVKMDVSVRELLVVQTDRTGTAATLTLEEATDLAPKHNGYLLDHFHVKADGKLLTGSVTGITPPKVIGEGSEAPDNSHFRYTIEYPLAAPPAAFTFSHNMCKEFPSAPGIPWDLSYAYRYGRKGETPVKFGALLLDREVSFSSGFVSNTATASPPAPANGQADPGPGMTPVGEWKPQAITVIGRPLPAIWLTLWLIFVAATALGSEGKLLWYQLALLVWLGGYLAAAAVLNVLPLWLAGLLAGGVTILTAVDCIYAPAAGGLTLRRIVLMLVGATVCGIGLSHEQPAEVTAGRIWMAQIVLSAVGVAAAIRGLKVLALRRGPQCTRLFVQIASLICCGAAIWLMLRLLNVA